MKLCIIGDSHMAAPKRAQDEGLFRSCELEIAYFGVGGLVYNELECDDDRIYRLETPNSKPIYSSPAADHVRLDAFDAFVFYGARLRWESLFGRFEEVTKSSRPFYSQAFLENGWRSFLTRYKSVDLASRLAPRAGRSVLVAPCPLRARPDSGDRDGISAKRANHAWHFFDGLFAKWGIDLLPPPVGTVAANFYTHPKFNVGASRLNPNPKDKVDNAHMNSEYGAIFLSCLEQFLVKGTKSNPFG